MSFLFILDGCDISYTCEDVLNIYNEVKNKGGWTWGHIFFESELPRNMVQTDSLKGLLYFVSISNKKISSEEP